MSNKSDVDLTARLKPYHAFMCIRPIFMGLGL